MSDRLFTSGGKASSIWLYSFSINKKQNYKKSDLKDQVENNNQVNDNFNKKDHENMMKIIF